MISNRFIVNPRLNYSNVQKGLKSTEGTNCVTELPNNQNTLSHTKMTYVNVQDHATVDSDVSFHTLAHV